MAVLVLLLAYFGRVTVKIETIPINGHVYNTGTVGCKVNQHDGADKIKGVSGYLFSFSL